ALNRAQRQIITCARGEGRRPFERNDNENSLVEAAFAELLGGDIGQRKPGADPDAGEKTAPELEGHAPIAGEVLAGAYGDPDIVPRKLVIGSDMPGDGLVMAEVQQLIESALSHRPEIKPDGPARGIGAVQHFSAEPGKHLLQKS